MIGTATGVALNVWLALLSALRGDMVSAGQNAACAVFIVLFAVIDRAHERRNGGG